jgi:hypothetical protein
MISIEKAEIRVNLVDTHDCTTSLPATVIIEDGQIWIKAEGYGEQSAEDGEGMPINVELHEGKLKIFAWTDINSADPEEIIDMEGAREDRRSLDAEA